MGRLYAVHPARNGLKFDCAASDLGVYGNPRQSERFQRAHSRGNSNRHAEPHAVARSLARDRRRPLGADGEPPDDGRGHRRGRRPHDPRRRPVARRLRLLQLPRLRPRPRDHRRRCPAYLDAWGTHPSWSRLLGSPVLYEQIEERLTELLGCEDTLVLPTITHIHMSVIPLLAASGTIFLDARAHKTIYDGCQVARARGAAVRRFRFEDPDHLDELLTRRARPHAPGLHGRRQQHDRQRARPAARSPRSRAATARCSTSTTPTASASSASAARTRPAPTARAATASCATSARPTTTSCSSAASRRRTRRCWRSSPARPSSRSC